MNALTCPECDAATVVISWTLVTLFDELTSLSVDACSQCGWRGEEREIPVEGTRDDV